MNILREGASLFAELASKRLIIFQLARQDFRGRYLGSYLGFIWTFAQPLAMASILWLVFTIAFKAPEAGGAPFSLYLLAGIAAWTLFSESLAAATGVFLEYAFMVKKVNFKIVILPLVKIVSCLMVHSILLVIVMVLTLAGGGGFSFWWLQILYYMAAMTAFLVGLSLITSSINVFVRDMGQAINILLQFGFWLTPLVWHPERVPSKYLWILKLNPLFYVVNGYRASLLYRTPFWQEPEWACYFWAVTLSVLLLGSFVFRKLKVQFADVL